MVDTMRNDGLYELKGEDVREEDGYIRHYREMWFGKKIIASVSWKSGPNGYKKVHHGDKYAQYKARCAFGKDWAN